MTYEATLLVFGILLLLVGLVGKVKAKELEIGTSSTTARAVLGITGVALIVVSLVLFKPSILPTEGDQPDTEPAEESREPGVYLTASGERGEKLSRDSLTVISVGSTDLDFFIGWCLARDIPDFATTPLTADDITDCRD